MRKANRNSLLDRPLEFGDKDQIQALRIINHVIQYGFIVDGDKEHFKCVKCVNNHVRYKTYMDNDCDCTIDEDSEHDPECNSLFGNIPNQKVYCRNCNALYKIVGGDHDDNIEDGTGIVTIIGLQP